MAGHPLISSRGWLIQIQQANETAQLVTNSISSTHRKLRKKLNEEKGKQKAP